jgi:DNA polymerase epsilon subunit 2
MFIFVGNFCSSPFGQHDDDRDTFVRHLDSLASMIVAHPTLAAGSRFVFVPGPSDPGACGVLPRPPVIRTRRLVPRVRRSVTTVC